MVQLQNTDKIYGEASTWNAPWPSLQVIISILNYALATQEVKL